MTKSRILISVHICLVGLFASSITCASPITIYSNYSLADAGAESVTSNDSTFSTSIPLTDTLTATTGNSSSSVDIDFSGNTNLAVLTFGLTQSIDNTIGGSVYPDYARVQVNSLYFTANLDTTYSINGLSSLYGPAGTELFSYVRLQDFTTGVYLFSDYNQSYNTANESFTLGVSGDGDTGNATTGSLSGNLIAGHNYRLYIENRIQAYNGITSTAVAATADGVVNLYIGAVPVPAAVWLFGSGLLGLTGIARRRRA